MSYLCLNFEGFVEHGLIEGDAIPERLFRALHFLWLDHNPRDNWPDPTVYEVSTVSCLFE